MTVVSSVNCNKVACGNWETDKIVSEFMDHTLKGVGN
jgi:hypothetical protein